MAVSSAELSLASLRAAYAGGLSPADMLADIMQRIARYPRKGVWTYVCRPAEVEAQLCALAAAQRARRPLPLYGVPFAVKDNIDVAGVPTTAACPAYAYVPAQSAAVVRRLTDAGAIVVGKTNLDQFATGLVGTRSPYGACENAYDPCYISGGSSSGSAVAVAGGLVSFALGTDTAGSGRVPAAFNNIVGLKPTCGLISTTGMVRACRSLDCVSIFGLDCQDAAAVMEIAAGFDLADPLSRVAPANHSVEQTALSRPLRVGIPDQLEFFDNRDADGLFAQACTHVREAGAEVVPIDFAPFRRTADLLYNGPWVAERLLVAGKLLEENPAALRPELRAILEEAHRYTAADAFEGMYQLARLRRQTQEAFAQIDFLLTPTAGTIYTIAQVEADPLQLNRNLGHYTNFVNLLDLCAVAVPAGFLGNGLPWGVTFAAPAFHEPRLIPFAARFHAADAAHTMETRRLGDPMIEFSHPPRSSHG